MGRAAHIHGMEIILAIEAISSTAHHITTIADRTKDIYALTRHLAACWVYFTVVLSSRRNR